MRSHVNTMVLRLMSLPLGGCVFVCAIISIQCQRHSRVCSSPPQGVTTYEQHDIKCKTKKRIGIISAHYRYIKRTEDTDCCCGDAKCDNGTCLNKKAVECSKPQSDEYIWDLVSNCSVQIQCSVPLASLQNHTCSTSLLRASFSDVVYICEEVTHIVDCSNGTGSGPELSILFNKSSNKSNCQCSISAMDNHVNMTYYIFKSLDIRNASGGGGYYNLSFESENNTKHFFNATIPQNEELFLVPIEQKTVIHLTTARDKNGPDRIWIRVRGRNKSLTVTCQSEVETTTTGNPATTKPVVSTVATETTTSVQSTKTQTARKGYLAQAGPIAGCVVGGVLVIAAIAALIIFLRKRNRYTECPDESKKNRMTTICKETEDETVYCEAKGMSEEEQVEEKKSVMSAPYSQLEPHVKNHNIMNVDVSINEGYDQVTIANNSAPWKTFPDIYYQVTENTEEDCYNHLGKDTKNVTSGVIAKQPAYFQLELQPMNPNCMTVDVSNNEGYDHLAMTANPKSQQTTKDIYNHLTESTEEECYNHLKTAANQRPNLNVDYDTTASASKAVKDLDIQDDYYSYDHLEKSTGTTVADNVYDTTLPNTSRMHCNTQKY